MNTRDVLAQDRGLERHEVERLLMAVTGRSRASITGGIELTDQHVARFSSLVEERRSGRPLQYLEGSVPFGPADIAVDPRALIPRPETEFLFEKASEAVAEPSVVVDIGTGTGCLAIALKLTFPGARVVATDISPLALSLAHENAERNGVDIEFHVGDRFQPVPRALEGEVDLFVSNPPYVATAEMAELPREVGDWEPALALDGGEDGLDVVRPLIEELPRWLAPAGVGFIEVGSSHAEAAAASAIPVFEQAEVLEDLTGRSRIIRITHGSRHFGVAGDDD